MCAYCICPWRKSVHRPAKEDLIRARADEGPVDRKLSSELAKSLRRGLCQTIVLNECTDDPVCRISAVDGSAEIDECGVRRLCSSALNRQQSMATAGGNGDTNESQIHIE
jgi:hypothetical protein